jgi:putative acetyltransferase
MSTPVATDAPPVTIRPLSEADFTSLREALDTVARERRYLTLFQAPPVEECLAFYRKSIEHDLCHFVAVTDRVIGWCDVQPVLGEARAHVGVLGMGLVPDARGQGIGSRLMAAALAGAWQRGLTRVQLTVRADNLTAIRLYQRFGFVVEGRLRRDFRVGDEVHDGLVMALLREAADEG